MHPTADTTDVVFGNRAGRRVMPGVRLLMRFQNSTGWMRGRGGWRSDEVETSPAAVDGLTPKRAGGGRHGAG